MANQSFQLHRILLHRNPIADKFGKRPVIGIQLRVFHGEDMLFENEHLDVTWYQNIPPLEAEPQRVKDDTTKAGYQYNPK